MNRFFHYVWPWTVEYFLEETVWPEKRDVLNVNAPTNARLSQGVSRAEEQKEQCFKRASARTLHSAVREKARWLAANIEVSANKRVTPEWYDVCPEMLCMPYLKHCTDEAWGNHNHNG